MSNFSLVTPADSFEDRCYSNFMDRRTMIGVDESNQFELTAGGVGGGSYSPH